MNLNTGGWASRVLTPLLRVVRGATNATVPVIAISEPVNSETAAATDADIALVAKNAGATLAQVPDGTVVGGNKRGAYATDWQKGRTAATHVASGQTSVIGGGGGNTASGSLSAITGGSSNTASSTYSFVGGGQSNLAQTNTHAAVCGGSGNTASGQYAFVGSGTGNIASGSRSSIAGGDTCTASAIYATVCGGWQNTSDGNSSFVTGKRSTTRGIEGNFVLGGAPLPNLGNSQASFVVLGVETTTNTATVLTSNQAAASTTNQVILPNNSAYYFRGSVIAGVTGAGDTKAWTFEGAIKRGANAASTTIVGTVVLNVIAADTGASAWTVAITADTTNGGIAVTATGAASTTIRWVTKIETTEMTY